MGIPKNTNLTTCLPPQRRPPSPRHPLPTPSTPGGSLLPSPPSRTALDHPARPSSSTSVPTTRLMLPRLPSRSVWHSSVELPRELSRWPELQERELDLTRLLRLRSPRRSRRLRSQRPRSQRRSRRQRSQLPRKLRSQRRLPRSQLLRRLPRSLLPRKLPRSPLPRRLPPRRSRFFLFKNPLVQRPFSGPNPIIMY